MVIKKYYVIKNQEGRFVYSVSKTTSNFENAKRFTLEELDNFAISSEEKVYEVIVTLKPVDVLEHIFSNAS